MNVVEGLNEKDLRAINALRQCTEVPTFIVDGRWYKGSSLAAVSEFIKNNPEPADFSVWLQDNWEEFKIIEGS